MSSGCAAEASRSSAMRRSSSTRRFSRSTIALLFTMHVLEQPDERLFELAPVDDHVDGALLQQELGGLELIRQTLANRLLDDAASREADHRLRFRDDDVGLKGERRRDAAGR